jgi:hypothetical protein
MLVVVLDMSEMWCRFGVSTVYENRRFSSTIPAKVHYRVVVFQQGSGSVLGRGLLSAATTMGNRRVL